MLRRRSKARDQQVAPKGPPGPPECRRRASQLPLLKPPELRAVSSNRSVASAGGPGDGAGWWQTSAGSRSAAPRPPSASPAATQAPRSPLLPPLVLGCEPGRPATSSRGLGESQDPRRDRAGGAPDTLRGLVGELLPDFRELLRQLRVENTEQKPPQLATSSASQHQKAVPGHYQSPHRPSCSFLPDRWVQSLQFQKGLEKILLHQLPALLPQRSEQLQLKRANQQYRTQAPQGKTVPTYRSSGEGPEARPPRRYCPFRVRFADETLRDTALRYWERSCRAAQQGIADNSVRPVVPPRVLGTLGRWLETLPATLYAQPVEEAAVSPAFSWDCPGPPHRQVRDMLCENPSVNSSLSCTPRAAAQGQREDLKAFLEAHGILDQAGKPPTWSRKLESFLPRLVLNSVLKRGRPKGYQLLLPPTAWQQTQR